MEQQRSAPYARTSALFLSIALLLALMTAVGIVVRPFVLPLLWATVLTTATWPLFIATRERLGGRVVLSACAITTLLGLILLLVTIPLPLQLAGEVRQLGSQLRSINTSQVSSFLSDIPVVGSLMAAQAVSILQDDGGIASLIATHQADLFRLGTSAARGILETVTTAVLALAGCFIFYLHGEKLLGQMLAVMRKLGGTRVDGIFTNVGATVRGAAYSVIATAIAQGILAGIGYSLAGAPLPLLLALTTMVLSLLPFGAPLLYVPVAAYLVLGTDQPWYYGVALLAWGIGVVSTVDNFLRSILISQANQVSMVLVFIGVVGGVLAFGLLGVFIGPALISVAQTLWLEFADARSNVEARPNVEAR